VRMLEEMDEPGLGEHAPHRVDVKHDIWVFTIRPGR